MSGAIRAAFEFEAILVRLDRLLPTRPAIKGLQQTAPYKTILASVREVGLIEPLSVSRLPNGKYLLLDGHVRLEVLRELGHEEVLCLVSTTDEGYTYNAQVNRIAPIQANRMILKALDAGVSEERIASTLNRTVGTVRQSRNLMRDICPEAVELLKDKPVALRTLSILKKVKPLRQIEMAETMVAAGTYTATYARALVLITNKDQLVHAESPKNIPGVKAEDLARLERELRVVETDYRLLDETYNENVMALTITRGYVRQLLENKRVVRYLSQKYKEVLGELQRIVETTLDG